MREQGGIYNEAAEHLTAAFNLRGENLTPPRERGFTCGCLVRTGRVALAELFRPARYDQHTGSKCVRTAVGGERREGQKEDGEEAHGPRRVPRPE